MKFPFKEPVSSRYVYISPNNVVHLFMPVVSGTSIGLDNTCKSVYALQAFFGKSGSMAHPNTVKKVLLDYRAALEGDLGWTGIEDPIAQQKKERLTQIRTYLEILEYLEQSDELNSLQGVYPSYPRPLEVKLQDKSRSNLHSIILHPTAQDAFIRTESSTPLFSVAHDSELHQRWNTESVLQQALLSAYTGLKFAPQNVRSQLIERVLAQFPLETLGYSDFELLQKSLYEEVKALTGVAIDFNQNAVGECIDKAYIDALMAFDSSSPPQDYIEALLGCCANELTVIESPFNIITTAEQWSIVTQFLLGITSLYCVSQSKINSNINWGKILDENPALSQSLAETMAQAQQSKQSPEEHLVNWINAHSNVLGLNTPLSSEDILAIKGDFAARYIQIKESPHFDEFFLLDTRNKGSFVVHQGSMCASFADFSASPIFDLPQEKAALLKAPCKDFEALEGLEIPHQNPRIQPSIDLNLSLMNLNALQALYDQINTYKDSELKKTLLKQLAQERPDFKSQIDTKAFLQHVAYGEQDDAEALLKKDSDLAQELVFAQNIQFTDYSGRTFTCSAYEYAYWAKDTHMCRMLEKHMKEHTKAEVLKRIDTLEELIQRPGLFRESRGLTYKQKGNEYRSTHFDLKPLINALQHLVEEYDKNPNKSDEDWAVLDKIWREVGQAQRNLPAHIAQEYCHPDRTFESVFRSNSLLDASNPNNLKRKLKFFNFDTLSNDLWFTPDSHSVDSGLGFSFAIVGTSGAWGLGSPNLWRVMSMRELHENDRAVLTLIDEVRTSDLKQSRDNLSSPLSAQATQGHTI